MLTVMLCSHDRKGIKWVCECSMAVGYARRAVLLRLLADAIDEAETFACKRRIADDLGEIRALIESLPAE